jgi:hypothetical protein
MISRVWKTDDMATREEEEKKFQVGGGILPSDPPGEDHQVGSSQKIELQSDSVLYD